MAIPGVKLKRTKLYSIVSEINAQKYDIYVRLPNGYDDRPADKKYPTLYILNGQWDFGLMLSIHGSLNYDGLLPEMILIGIGWTEQETDEEAQKLSMSDYSAFLVDGQLRGGAEPFLNVLESEMIPFVERNFSVNDERYISGSSVAAWFALFCAFNKPKLFRKYILSSPITWFANGFIFYIEDLFFKSGQELDAYIYISYGELEPNKQIKDFVNAVRSRGNAKLQIVDEEIDSVGHAGNKPVGYTKGLRQCFQRSHDSQPSTSLV